MSGKRKLLVVSGAGASVQFGMPPVSGVHELLLELAIDSHPLASDPTRSLYSYLYDEIDRYWSGSLPPSVAKHPNFEDILFALYELASTGPAGIFTAALGAFVRVRRFPEVVQFGQRVPTDSNVLRTLSAYLVDGLLDRFRQLCKDRVKPQRPLQKLLNELQDQFDIAVVTTNYDDLIYRALPGIETGFDLSDTGRFKQERVISRSSWPCMLHLHGSVHFNMEVDQATGELHRVFWEDDLNNQFQQNAFGRSSVQTIEGSTFPTSNIVAGYGKAAQLVRAPFRTYYSELDRLVLESDALLFLGYGFGDTHLNSAFGDYRDARNRRVVVVDFADDRTMTARGDRHERSMTANRAMEIFRTPPHRMSHLGRTAPDSIGELKAAREFERSSEDSFRLSIWYNGMLEACANADRILRELVI